MDDALIVRVTDHAYEQYCSRVEQVDRRVLREQLTRLVNSGVCHRSGESTQIERVWWVFEIVGDVMIMITCYGRTDIDIPKALKWCKLHGDRINLDGTR